jgi:hypothetical protein
MCPLEEIFTPSNWEKPLVISEFLPEIQYCKFDYRWDLNREFAQLVSGSLVKIESEFLSGVESYIHSIISDPIGTEVHLPQQPGLQQREQSLAFLTNIAASSGFPRGVCGAQY